MDTPDNTVFIIAKKDGETIFHKFINLRHDKEMVEDCLELYVQELKDMI